MISRIALGLVLGIASFSAAKAAGPVHVYGPGGPFPAMKEIAATYGKTHDIDVQVTAGPTGKWLAQAKLDADVIFSGSESMMTDCQTAFTGQIDAATVIPLYLRPSAILVRPGNPGHITGLADLLKPGHKVLVVNGSGQGGLWEDIAGRLGDIRSVRALRANIGNFAQTSADAKVLWTSDPSYDAWLIWNIWQIANADIAAMVSVEPEYRAYRDTGMALTQRGEQRPEAKAFVAYLSSPKAAAIFAKWGWIDPASK